MEAARREARVPLDRIVGSAAARCRSSGVPSYRNGCHRRPGQVAGRPPCSSWLGRGHHRREARHRRRSRAPPARNLTVSGELWPPGPQAIAAATAPVVEALISGSRQPLPAGVLEERVRRPRCRCTGPVRAGNTADPAPVLPTQSPQEPTKAGSVFTSVTAGSAGSDAIPRKVRESANGILDCGHRHGSSK